MTRADLMRPTVTVRMAICGNIIERHDVDEVVDIVKTRLALPTGGGFAVGSVNLDHLHHFGNTDSAERPAGPKWLLLADGMPIAWRGQLLTAQPWPRVTGADLLPRLLELAEDCGYRVGFLGGSIETQTRLAGHLAERYPHLAVAGMWSPDPDQLAPCSADIAAAIRDAGTEILVVSLGKPRQEQWVDTYGPSTEARLFLPFGGAIDFLVGTKRRAPQWMQRSGLEWFYRLSREPRRLARRYLIQGPICLVRALRAQVVHSSGVPQDLRQLASVTVPAVDGRGGEPGGQNR
jgi:N-acetylglucosaminyldiphosphoundecaprenol N-acetyl-beta-D-mannosaminyltransferase